MKVENALFTFISLGRQDIIPDLIRVLNNKGTKNTAEIYLNCGNSQLEAAAMTWAKRHGYHITSLPGSGPVKWGNW
jgi:hypothetical protein